MSSLVSFRSVRAASPVFLVAVLCAGCPQTPPASDAGPADGGSGCAAPARCIATMTSLGVIPGATQATAIAVAGGEVFVGTDVGVFRRALDASSEWTLAGLAGLEVTVVRAHPTDSRLLVAGIVGGLGPPVFISVDGGTNWTQTGDEFLPMPPEPAIYDSAHDVAFDSAGAILVNANASAIVRSNDRGASWMYVDGSPGHFGYACYLAVDGPTLLQGCELPLDSAWIDRMELTPAGLGPRTRVVGLEQISNRRPNALVTSPHYPGRVWAGLEGGLIWIEGSTWGWIYQATEETADYVYVRGVWIDPDDRRHLVFGGIGNAEGRLPLLETFDDGESRAWAELPEAVNSPYWGISAMANTGRGDDRVVMAVTATATPIDDGGTAYVFVRAHRR